MNTFIEQGYYYYPSRYSIPLGHPQLDVYISSALSNRLIDVCEAIFPIADANGINELSIVHPWREWMGSEIQKVCAGQFQILDNHGEAYHGFSLGGILKIQNQDTFTLCSLSSSAPIFSLERDDPRPEEELLVDEIKVLIAERMAAWGTDESNFAKRMNEVDPNSLFSTSLNSLTEAIKGMPLEVREHGYQSLLRFIESAIQTIKLSGEWPEEVLPLADLI